MKITQLKKLLIKTYLLNYNYYKVENLFISEDEKSRQCLFSVNKKPLRLTFVRTYYV